MKRSLFKVCKGYLKLESYCPIKLGVWSDSSCKSVIENTSLLHGNTNVSGYTWTQLLIAFSSFFGNFGFRFSTGGEVVVVIVFVGVCVCGDECVGDRVWVCECCERCTCG